MNQMVEGRRIPGIESTRFLQPAIEQMGSEGALGDSEKNDGGRNSNGSGLLHCLVFSRPLKSKGRPFQGRPLRNVLQFCAVALCCWALRWECFNGGILAGGGLLSRFFVSN
jgi:hypothetical protein